MADRVGCGPNTVWPGSVVLPADAFEIQQVAHRVMFEAGKDGVGWIFDAESIDQLNPDAGIGSASRCRSLPNRVRRGKRTSVILLPSWCRGGSEDELMGGETGSLVGLEHVVGP